MQTLPWQVFRQVFRNPARWITGRRYGYSRSRYLHSTTRLRAPPPSRPQDAGELPRSPAREKEEDAERRATNNASSDKSREGDDTPGPQQSQAGPNVKRNGAAFRRPKGSGRNDGMPPIHIPGWFIQRNVVLRRPGTQYTGVSPCSRTFEPKTRSKSTLNLEFEDLKSWCQGSCAQLGHKLSSAEFDDQIDPQLREYFCKSNTPESSQQHSYVGGGNSTEYSDFSRLMLLKASSGGIGTYKAEFQEIKHTVRACLELAGVNSRSSQIGTRANLILHSPEDSADIGLLQTVTKVADDVGADVVFLDAQDLALLLGEYLKDDGKLSHQKVSDLGFDAYQTRAEEVHNTQQQNNEDEEEIDGDEHDDIHSSIKSAMQGLVGSTGGLQLSGASSRKLKPGLIILGQSQMPTSMLSRFESLSKPQNVYDSQLDTLKIKSWLDAILDIPQSKRDKRSPANVASPAKVASDRSFFDAFRVERAGEDRPVHRTHHRLFHDTLRYTVAHGPDSVKHVESLELDEIRSDGVRTVYSTPSRTIDEEPRTIICVRDIKEIEATESGSLILAQLREVIRQRRGKGEKVMLLGTSASRMLTPELSPEGVKEMQSMGEEDDSRTIFIASPARYEDWIGQYLESLTKLENDLRHVASEKLTTTQRRLKEINTRNVLDKIAGLTQPQGASPRSFPPPRALSWVPYDRILTMDEVHRIAVIAYGFAKTSDRRFEGLSHAHLKDAADLIAISDAGKSACVLQAKQKEDTDSESSDLTQAKPVARSAEHQIASAKARLLDERVERIKQKGSKHEKSLLPGVVNPHAIRTTFDDVHVPEETVDALKTLTTLSIGRPDAFSYGVLARDRLNGLMLYGPPGTGKTLLARAVAKESQATVLEVSGSDVNEMYVGEGEKKVRAVFSVARQLSPCIVFIDEADAIFGSRSSAERKGHRELINQFLKEWDGMSQTNVFIMVATNRPFDLDDAVLRRLPRRLLVDLPTKEDREKIFRIHLQDEQLDDTISIPNLAEDTHLYSGSDIKNLCVAAALACVKEENANAQAQKTSGKPSVDGSTNTPLPGSNGSNRLESKSVETYTDTNSITPDAVDRDTSPSSPPEKLTYPTSLTDFFTHAPPTTNLETLKAWTQEKLANIGLAANASSDFSLTSPPSTSLSSTTSNQPPPPPQHPVSSQPPNPPPPPSTPAPSSSPSSPSPSPYPPRRTLHARHFAIALGEITASISEDMSSLRAIRKFDEQYGDRAGKGRRKKSSWGFGEVDEESERRSQEAGARVRGRAG